MNITYDLDERGVPRLVIDGMYAPSDRKVTIQAGVLASMFHGITQGVAQATANANMEEVVKRTREAVLGSTVPASLYVFDDDGKVASFVPVRLPKDPEPAA